MKVEVIPTAALLSGKPFWEAPVSFGSDETHVAHLLYMCFNVFWQTWSKNVTDVPHYFNLHLVATNGTWIYISPFTA